MNEPRYTYDKRGVKASRVGQAVVDILSQKQPDYTAEEILDQLGKDWLDLIRQRAEEGKKAFEGPFFILSLLKKELGHMGVDNVLKHSARCFKKRFTPQEVMIAHPNSTKTLFRVDAQKGEIDLEWSIPGWEDCKSILKNPAVYDPQLVKWVKECSNSFAA
jgi:hypothetical protein